jgi:hypothetical protein
MDYCCHPVCGIDPVDGKVNLRHCSVMRLNFNPCGVDGKLFEQEISIIDKVKGWFRK